MINVATWNVLAPAYAKPSRYPGVAPEDLAAERRVPRVRARLVELLRACDVVAVQEADRDLVSWLTEEAGAHVVHAPRPSSTDGVVLASHHPLVGVTGVSGDGRRTWCAAEVGGLLVVSVHLDPEWPARGLHGRRQAQELLAWLEETGASSIVVLGDLNTTWAGPAGSVLRDGGFLASGAGATAATNGRCRELDVVAVRGAMAAVDPTGLPPVGDPLWLPDRERPSDHVVVVARVSVQDG